MSRLRVVEPLSAFVGDDVVSSAFGIVTEIDDLVLFHRPRVNSTNPPLVEKLAQIVFERCIFDSQSLVEAEIPPDNHRWESQPVIGKKTKNKPLPIFLRHILFITWFFHSCSE